MKSLVRWTVISMAVSAVACCRAQDRSFSVADDIAMVRFSDTQSSHNPAGSEVVLRSPDGKYFAVVTTQGLLKSDKVESVISVFDLSELSAFLTKPEQQRPRSRVIARIVSFPHREEPSAYAPVIKDVRWSLDGTRVYFKGESLTGAFRLYSATLDGKRCHALTGPDESVGRFDVSKNIIVYTSSWPMQNHRDQADQINADAQSIAGHSVMDILFPGQLNSITPETFTLSVRSLSKEGFLSNPAPRYSVREIPYMSYLFPFSLSPKADKLIGMQPASTIPDAWTKYVPAVGLESLRFKAGDNRRTSVASFLRPSRYTLIDLETGAVTPLIEGPNARILGYNLDNHALWAKDEQRVLVTNVFLPATAGPNDSTDKPCAVASVDLPTLKANCLFFEEGLSPSVTLNVKDLAFGVTSDEVFLLVSRGQTDREVRQYQFRDGIWRLSSSNPVSPTLSALADFHRSKMPPGNDLWISVRQSLNDPPTLWVSDNVTGQARVVWDPNPQFRHLRFGNASMYKWKDATGYEWTSVLVKPVGYEPGREYPLVVQLYSFVPDEFITDGLYPTAFAARELASAGFFVLQIRKKLNSLSEADPRDHLEAYRSAIDSLARKGLIDRRRVGVVGFSWTCWYAVNALIKDPHLFAAATIADGIDNSYLQYMLAAPENSAIQMQMEKIRGGSPFGDGLARWVKEAPAFHLDQVQVPVRIEAIGPVSVLQEWELYASLRLQKKPVDFIYFPYGTHAHQKPLERLESQQGNVDWFRFWLQGYEDPTPSKASQYERWRKLRKE